ncbi:hypothetical protein OAA42_00620 [Pelagibacteraceae bacterium]|nr:hypothetical protein [Pelagibacteraceae bacterium]
MIRLFKLEYFTILLLFAIWGSLDSDIVSALSIFSLLNIFSFLDLFSILRALGPYVIFVIFIFFYYKKLRLRTSSRNLNFILTILVLNFLIQLIASFVYQNNTLLINSNLILLSCISLALFIIEFNLDNSKKILVFSWFILFLIFMWFSSIMFLWYFSDQNNFANLYHGWPDSFLIIEGLTENIPRSSGIGRTALILSIPIMLSLLIKKKINVLLYFFYNYSFFIILTTQSRIVLLGLFLFICVTIFYLGTLKQNPITKIKKICLIILIPIVFFLIMISLKTFQLENILKVNDKGNDNIGNYGKNYKFTRPIDPLTFTSNRYSDWQKILKRNNNILLGNGTMGDRWIVNQTASNLILYNYASSGIVGVFLFALLILRSFFICSKIILFDEKKINYNNYVLLSACYIQFFLMGRSLVESSFAIFGIDFLVFFSAYFFTEQYCYKQKLVKKNN